MEQNKVLMIIVSVAIFFAAIVGVGVALLYPRDDSAAMASESTTSRGFDPIEYVRRPDTARLDESTEEEEPVIIVYGERDGEGDQEVDVQGTRAITLEPAATEEDREASRQSTTEREPAVSPTTREEETPEAESSTSTSTSTTRDSASTDSGSTESATTSAPVAPSVTERRVEPRRIRVTEYWIQLIASPSKDRVEYAQDLLADYSLGGRVTTRDVNGELYYRLRVGPYENHQEAEKFLTWIQDIDGFAEAYISEEYPLRTVNG